ncbi:LOW QUALITY PROTEIN: aryl hydrocarbon receptor-like [Embiotoca jacksoni]|uniref:LOW QUALITY PROTEIN: aryl hydrocarbon receptor-like n=1 Tax=Embiotoca jacksoni TaxID=100190 RepID=UPI003703B45B
MLGNPGTYANKKRKKPALKQKKISEGNEVVKSNPSKRHRDRLNGELDRLMDLLPFPEDVRSRLDKLSVLRLSVGYLRVKSYFKATAKTSSGSIPMFPGLKNGSGPDTAAFSEGDLLLQALNGFVMVVTSDGSVFYSSATITDYLGFHQSDVVHQSVFDLIHTDDRATFREQLHFALNPPPAAGDGDALQCRGEPVTYNPEHLPPENSSFLERSFMCRFRCLLDNSSGFLALKFQGRLKYLHGQSHLRDNGTVGPPQLALFAIAMPVQPPSIVEIRTKMLLFQSKHKLDFTPLGIDSRGKIILGYSETELCTRGSGYQFIHAADMMYCADNHIRMMKTGESGLTVFRLLSKLGGWVWVKANAKLIYKGGRPDFIIVYQRALVNTEGEEYLRQRRLQLPFNFTTGEAVLYNTGPTIDLPQFHFNKTFGGGDAKPDLAPGCLLDCFLSQDEAVYTQTATPPLPVDQVFMESRALLSVASDAWQGNEATAVTAEPVVVKEEAKRSVMAVMDGLEKMVHRGDFGAALQDLQVGEAELTDWENALKRLSQDQEEQSHVRSDLDGLLANDIFDYIDSVLFKEAGDDGLSGVPPGCLTQDFSELCKPPLPSNDRCFSPTNGLYARPVNGESAQLFVSTQRLSHRGPLVPADLHEVFGPSLERPELAIPDISADHAPFQSCGQARHSGLHHGVSGPDPLLWRQNDLQNRGAPAGMDVLPPLIPVRFSSSSSSPSSSSSSSCLRDGPPLEAPHLPAPLQPWPHAGIVHNGHEPAQAFPSQNSPSQTFPFAGFRPTSVTGLNHSQQGGGACGQAAVAAASLSSCIFEQCFSSGPAPDTSPPRGSCYFQWSRSEPAAGTSAVGPENGNIGPLTAPPTMMSSEHARNLQLYLDNRQMQQSERVAAGRSGKFVAPAQDISVYLME